MKLLVIIGCGVLAGCIADGEEDPLAKHTAYLGGGDAGSGQDAGAPPGQDAAPPPVPDAAPPPGQDADPDPDAGTGDAGTGDAGTPDAPKPTWFECTWECPACSNPIGEPRARRCASSQADAERFWGCESADGKFVESTKMTCTDTGEECEIESPAWDTQSEEVVGNNVYDVESTPPPGPCVTGGV